MRFGRRDHESSEHEMPDPDREPHDRWQSDVYRGRDRFERDRWRDEWDDWSVNPYDRDRDGRGRGGRY